MNMINRIRLYWLKRRWKKKQAEAMQSLLLLIALIDGALLAEFLSLFRELLHDFYPEGVLPYKIFIFIITPIAIVGTWWMCMSWIKPLDEAEKKLRMFKKK